MTPSDQFQLLEAYRTLVHHLPAGAMLSAHRDAGALTGTVTVTMPDGETTTYDGAGHTRLNSMHRESTVKE